VVNGGVRWSGGRVYCRGRGGRVRPLRRPWSPRQDVSLSGELRVAREVLRRADMVGVRQDLAGAAWPCRARPCASDVAHAARGVPGTYWARVVRGVSASIRPTAGTGELLRSRASDLAR
jgi:hypothetical protein